MTQIVLINVVVAVLLEKFVSNEEVEEDAGVDARIASLDSQEASNSISRKLDDIKSILDAKDPSGNHSSNGDIHAKLDKSLAKLENLESTVAHLANSVANL